MTESKDIHMAAVSSQPRGSSQPKDALAESDFAADSRPDETFGDAVRSYLRRVRGGEKKGGIAGRIV